MDVVLGIALIVLNIPVYKIIFKLIFNNVEDFRQSLKYSFTPDLFSLFKGRFWKDQVGEAKLSFYIFVCIITVVIEFFIINSIINIFI